MSRFTNSLIRVRRPVDAIRLGLDRAVLANPTSGSSTLHLVNVGLMSNDPDYEIFLWVNDLSTAFSVGGPFGQGPYNRVWYPQHFMQAPFTVQGQCVSQLEYDRLARFVQHHHFTAIDSTKYQGHEGLTRDTNDSPIRFMLHPTTHRKDLHPLHRYNGIALEGYVLDFKGGHRRFEYAPDFTITFKMARNLNEKGAQYNAEYDRLLKENYKQSIVGGGNIDTSKYNTPSVATPNSFWSEFTQNQGTSLGDLTLQQQRDYLGQ